MEKSNRVKGFIAFHKEVPYDVWDSNIWTPIQVNSCNSERIKTYGGVADNEGVDNISYWNPFYAETTALYWIWKNLTMGGEFVMFCQYRRRFNIHSEETIDELFKEHDVVAAAPIRMSSTVAQQYSYCHSTFDLPKIKKVLLSLYPEYERSWEAFIENGHLLFYSNGFIMTESDYDRYCGWLFSILGEYKKELGYNTVEELDRDISRQIEEGVRRPLNNRGTEENAVQYQRQLGGFASERLLTLYILHNYPHERIGVIEYKKMENCL